MTKPTLDSTALYEKAIRTLDGQAQKLLSGNPLGNSCYDRYLRAANG